MSRTAVATDTVDVEIVIPVYNEEAGLEASVRRLHGYLSERFPLTWLITIADNASTDQTWGIACRLADELDGVRAVHLDQKGRGRALRAAWSASPAPRSSPTWTSTCPPTSTPSCPLVAPLLSGHSDVAIGSRLASGARVVRGPEAGGDLPELQPHPARPRCATASPTPSAASRRCGPTSPGRCCPLVEDDGWFFDTELLVLAEHNGLRIHEVPVDWVDDPDSRVHVGQHRPRRPQGDLADAAPLRGRAGQPARRRSTPPPRGRPGLAGQLVRFAGIGATTTVLFGLLFLTLAGPLGPVGADAVALALSAVINTAANRRVTFARQGPSGRRRQYASAWPSPPPRSVVTIAALVALGWRASRRSRSIWPSSRS